MNCLVLGILFSQHKWTKTVDILLEIMDSRRQWNDVFIALKENWKLRILFQGGKR